MSLVSLLVGYLLTATLKELAGLPAEGAYSLAIVACSIMNFFGCRYYVFRGNKAAIWKEAAKFFPSVLAFRALEIVLFSILHRLIGNYHIAYFATASVSMVFKLLVARFFIFRRS